MYIPDGILYDPTEEYGTQARLKSPYRWLIATVVATVLAIAGLTWYFHAFGPTEEVLNTQICKVSAVSEVEPVFWQLLLPDGRIVEAFHPQMDHSATEDGSLRELKIEKWEYGYKVTSMKLADATSPIRTCP